MRGALRQKERRDRPGVRRLVWVRRAGEPVPQFVTENTICHFYILHTERKSRAQSKEKNHSWKLRFKQKLQFNGWNNIWLCKWISVKIPQIVNIYNLIHRGVNKNCVFLYRSFEMGCALCCISCCVQLQYCITAMQWLVFAFLVKRGQVGDIGI